VAEIWSEQPAASVLPELYRRAAALEKNPFRHHLYLGKAACLRKSWDEAWRQFEWIYARCRDNPAVLQEIASIYRRADKRDLELCIWLTRYLRVAPLWFCFERAWEERNAIEGRHALERFRLEKGPDIAWDARKGPLKVCFPDSGAAGYDDRLRNEFHEGLYPWVRAMGGKLDFVDTADPKQANIICRWNEPEKRYAEYEGSKTAPRGAPTLPDGGNTTLFLCSDSHHRMHAVRAEIDVFAYQGGSMRTIDSRLLRAVVLHEIGHAVGIMKHLANRSDNVYYCMNVEEPPVQLSAHDKGRVLELYMDHPVNERAVEKFIGLRAVCQKLGPLPMDAHSPATDCAADLYAGFARDDQIGWGEP